MNRKVEASPLWAQGLKSPEGFREEQARLGEYWTVVGLTTDVTKDGDWFRSMLGGRSIFVQRFHGELRAFENVCMHRFYPLRTEDKGNGPVRCGFHHWQYNKDGLAVGIPKCEEMFGKIPRDLDIRLRPVEIATCGILIFGRFPSEDQKQTLEEYLGDGYPILKAMWGIEKAPYVWERKVKANWKLPFHISLDDYHVVAVHPDSFGKDGYLPNEMVKYFRFGRHSVYIVNGKEDALIKMRDACANGKYRPSQYRIFQFFPNLLAVHFEEYGIWYVHMQVFIPIAHDRTLHRGLWAEAMFQNPRPSLLRRLYSRMLAPIVRLFIPYYMVKIAKQDNEVCENIQTIASQIEGPQIYGRQEERIAWFEQEYEKAVLK